MPKPIVLRASNLLLAKNYYLAAQELTASSLILCHPGVCSVRSIVEGVPRRATARRHQRVHGHYGHGQCEPTSSVGERPLPFLSSASSRGVGVCISDHNNRQQTGVFHNPARYPINSVINEVVAAISNNGWVSWTTLVCVCVCVCVCIANSGTRLRTWRCWCGRMGVQYPNVLGGVGVGGWECSIPIPYLYLVGDCEAIYWVLLNRSRWKPPICTSKPIRVPLWLLHRIPSPAQPPLLKQVAT